MISLAQPYSHFLKSRTSVTISNEKQIKASSNGLLMSTFVEPKPLIIPPMNADLNFVMLSSIASQAAMTQFKQTIPDNPNLPISFDWAKTIPQITPVLNQGKCGSCWAFAIATALSDNFVTQRVLPINPMISPTFLLSCYSGSSQCNGGNPASALDWISKNGIGTDDVLNYQWCLENDVCGGAQKTISSSLDLNSLIPQCPIQDTENQLKFFVNHITTPNLQIDPLKNPTLEEIQSSIHTVQNFIFSRGPLVAGFQVYKNFFSGHFICNGKNPDNIYLESVDYESETWNPSKTLASTEYAGGHAVVVTGWGIGKVDGSLLNKTGPPQQYDVPYWIVRNTWTNQWGIDGYFRMAVYPFNQKSQFDTTVFVYAPDPDNSSNVQKIPTGGFLLFDLKYVGYSQPLVIEGYQSCSSSVDNTWFFILVIVSFTLLIFILFLLFIPKKKNNSLKT